MYIDTHAHLTDGAFDHDRQELIKGLAAGGIGKIIEISCDPKGFEASAELAEKNPGIYLAFGIHPEFAETYTESDIAALEKYLRHPKCVALGEIGLDYYWKPYNREKQLELFRRQLDMAIERDMPVSMHIREAYGDCMEVLESYRGRIKGVMHCFSGTIRSACPARKTTTTAAPPCWAWSPWRWADTRPSMCRSMISTPALPATSSALPSCAAGW